MTRVLAALFVSIVLGACGGGSSPAAPAVAQAPEPTAAEILAQDLAGLPLEQFYEVSYGALIRRSPETVVWLALESAFPLDSVGLDDLSDSYQRDTYEMYQVVLDALRGYDRSMLDAAQQVDFDVYDWYLQDAVDSLPFIYHGFPATYSGYGTQRDTQRFFTDIHPLATEQDANDYITRLSAVRGKFEQLSDHLELQRQAGIVEPQLTMQVARNQVSAISRGSAASNPYYTSFVEKIENIPGLTEADRQDLRDRAYAAVIESVVPGYQSLLATLDRLLASAPPSIGVGQYPNGGSYYAYILRHHTGTDLSAAEIHQLGLDELDRIHSEMRLIFDQLGYPQDESLQQLFGRVANDGGIVPAAQVRSTYEDLISFAEANIGEAFDIFPSADVVVADDPYGGFYIGPSFDGTRPGAFYAGTLNDQPYYDMPSLTFHESVPGHHTQIAIAMDQDVPAFRKLVRVTGFVEGWALYAERLAWELGWYDNDVYGDLGRLQYEALRAARLVIDTGIHEYDWSFDQAAQFNNENVGWSMSASQNAAGRYSVIPGQATAYMVGMLQILAERQRASDALGPAFDLKAFHRALLANGAVPLSLLDDVVDRYIAGAE
jgi:uncharacterized protein (DUF885 family)